MKKIGAAFALVVLMIGSYLAGRHHTSQAPVQIQSARHVLYWVDPMHPDYRSDHAGIAPDCGMELQPVYAENASAQIDSPAPVAAGMVGIDSERQQMFGIRVTAVEKTPARENVRVLGRVVPEDNRIYRIDAGMDGFVRDTFNDSVGTLVKKDQKLATCYGADALSVASGFLAATASIPGSTGRDGSRTVPFPGAVSKQGVSSIQGYTDRLRNLGMSDAQIKEMAENRQLPESVDLVSPVEGFILSRNISGGQHFDRSMEFYRIADLSRVWIVADIFASDAKNFRAGTPAHVTLAGGEKSFTARVTQILPQVDPSTRTLKLRLEAENPGFPLRPDMFVDVDLPAAVPEGLSIPVDALIDTGREQRVFVERSNGVFEPRLVQTGWRMGDRVEVVRGLSEGERVVSAGTFLVDSESRLKSSPSSTSGPQPEKTPLQATPANGVVLGAKEVKDPACGMGVDPAKSVKEGNTLTRDGVTYYFCSDRCKRKFSQEPEHVAALTAAGRRP
ncbi:MAG: efflux RND transporter periplasmic adaptor subunit [Acidobacteriota bacterium]